MGLVGWPVGLVHDLGDVPNVRVDTAEVVQGRHRSLLYGLARPRNYHLGNQDPRQFPPLRVPLRLLFLGRNTLYNLTARRAMTKMGTLWGRGTRTRSLVIQLSRTRYSQIHRHRRHLRNPLAS